MATNKIEFFCWENDERILIYLEPEGEEFSVSGNDILSIVVDFNSRDVDFKWSIRTNHKSASTQLYPECAGKYEIKIYKNDILYINLLN